MSTKKDKFSIKDKIFMELALKLAKARHGLTGINPSVGCELLKIMKYFQLVKQVLMANLMPNLMPLKIQMKI